MKFSEAWANVVKQNQHLKISLLMSVFTSIILAVCTIHFSMKEPLLFERGCLTSPVSTGEKEQTELEYQEFIKEALKQRFNTGKKVIEGFLSVSEKKNKVKEQTALKKNEITQFVIIRGFELKNDFFLIDADRLYSVNKIRSALPIKLRIYLKRKDRTETNPYGLILNKTEEVKAKNGGKNEKK